MDSPRIAHRLPIDFPRIATECPRSLFGLPIIVSKIAKPAMTTDLAEGIILIVWGSSVVDKVNHVVF